MLRLFRKHAEESIDYFLQLYYISASYIHIFPYFPYSTIVVVLNESVRYKHFERTRGFHYFIDLSWVHYYMYIITYPLDTKHSLEQNMTKSYYVTFFFFRGWQSSCLGVVKRSELSCVSLMTGSRLRRMRGEPVCQQFSNSSQK